MRIVMSKREAGFYAQWYEVLGERNGRPCTFLIYKHQADTYAKAARYWKERWGDRCKAHILRNAKPMTIPCVC